MERNRKQVDVKVLELILWFILSICDTRIFHHHTRKTLFRRCQLLSTKRLWNWSKQAFILSKTFILNFALPPNERCKGQKGHLTQMRSLLFITSRLGFYTLMRDMMRQNGGKNHTFLASNFVSRADQIEYFRILY